MVQIIFVVEPEMGLTKNVCARYVYDICMCEQTCWVGVQPSPTHNPNESEMTFYLGNL